MAFTWSAALAEDVPVGAAAVHLAVLAGTELVGGGSCCGWGCSAFGSGTVLAVLVAARRGGSYAGGTTAGCGSTCLTAVLVTLVAAGSGSGTGAGVGRFAAFTATG